MKNTTQAVKIIKRPFHDTAESRQRFKALMASFHQGIVLADNIFLSYENQGNHESTTFIHMHV